MESSERIVFPQTSEYEEFDDLNLSVQSQWKYLAEAYHINIEFRPKDSQFLTSASL